MTTHPVPIRPLNESDLDAARELLRAAVPVPSQLVALQAVVESAARSPNSEQRGLVVSEGGELAAFAVYGEYAGAPGAGRLHLVAVHHRHRRRGLGTYLIERIDADLGSHAARYILAELPDERPALTDYFAFLHARGFAEESRIPDFYREGVGLIFLRREAGGKRKQKAESRKQ
jgi:ribosomal protein S18 acetylase RimI-like enzyme